MTKADFDTELEDISKRITSSKTKHLPVENELKKLQEFDASYFRDDGPQNYLVFQPMYKYFKMVGHEISSWESKGFSNEKISFITTFNYSLAPKLIYRSATIRLEFN